MIIPISERGLIVSVGISEGDTKFLYNMKLMPPKNLGSIVQPDIIPWKYYL